MKTPLLLLFLCFLPSILGAQAHSSLQPNTVTNTQPTNPQAETNAGWKGFMERAPAPKIGFKAGLNLSNFNFNKGFPPPATPIESSWKTGFMAGFLLQVPFGNRLSIQQEYLYTQIGGADESIGTTYKLTYASFPMLFKVKLIRALSLMAGPQFDILLQAKKNEGGSSIDIINDIEERNIGATAGLEILLWNNLSTSARYMHGINHVVMGKWSSPKEFKHEWLQIALEYRL